MYLIGVTGASGSGKTTLAHRLLEHFGNRAVLLSLDSYYKDFPDLPFEKRAALNFDAPDIHDHALLEQDLRQLLSGHPAPRRVYTELDPDVCILRRVKRDMEERGRDLDGITLQYLRTVKPMYERYIRNYRECADIVVPTLVHSGIGAEMIALYVENHLNDKKGER